MKMDRIKTIFSVKLFIISWFAVLTQYYLMQENSDASALETTIRFFSFFTILTNTLVALYYTAEVFKITNGPLNFSKKPGVLTAITTYIFIVGLVYQILLRQLWHPEGLQRLVDELLHTLIPLAVVIYWSLYQNKSLLNYKLIPKWLLYPLFYLCYVLLLGSFSNFYPYPFIDAAHLSSVQVLINATLLTGLFVLVSFIFVAIAKGITKRNND